MFYSEYYCTRNRERCGGDMMKEGLRDPEIDIPRDEVGRSKRMSWSRSERTSEKNKSKKNFEKIWKIKIKILTFAPRFARNDWEEFFEKFTYTTVVQVFRMNTVKNTWTWKNNGILSKDIKQFEQRRVWSWLRMNASDRLNTCKSRGSMNLAC